MIKHNYMPGIMLSIGNLVNNSCFLSKYIPLLTHSPSLPTDDHQTTNLFSEYFFIPHIRDDTMFVFSFFT